jgi:hypothetical protein
MTVRFRTIPINTELRAFDDAVDVYMIDPRGFVVRRWLSRQVYTIIIRNNNQRELTSSSGHFPPFFFCSFHSLCLLQSNFGAVSLDYALSDQPTFGEWTIRVTAQGQTEEEHFHVEEYYQTRFEVNVTMPAFYFDSDDFIHGTVMANYTSGAPVRGNLTLKATFKPIRATPLIPDRPGSIRDSVIERNLTFKEVRGGWFTPHTREGSEVLKDVLRCHLAFFFVGIPDYFFLLSLSFLVSRLLHVQIPDGGIAKNGAQAGRNRASNYGHRGRSLP